MPNLQITPQDMQTKGNARAALKRITYNLCRFIRDKYGHIDDEVRKHMSDVVFWSKVTGAGLVLLSVYNTYVMPHHTEVFKRNINFFRNVDKNQYHDVVDGDGEYVEYIFEAFGKCYDSMTCVDQDYVWNCLESIVVVCQNYDSL